MRNIYATLQPTNDLKEFIANRRGGFKVDATQLTRISNSTAIASDGQFLVREDLGFKVADTKAIDVLAVAKFAGFHTSDRIVAERVYFNLPAQVIRKAIAAAISESLNTHQNFSDKKLASWNIQKQVGSKFTDPTTSRRYKIVAAHPTYAACIRLADDNLLHFYLVSYHDPNLPKDKWEYRLNGDPSMPVGTSEEITEWAKAKNLDYVLHDESNPTKVI